MPEQLRCFRKFPPFINMLRELFSKELVNFTEMCSVIGRFRFTHKLLGDQCDYSAA